MKNLSRAINEIGAEGENKRRVVLVKARRGGGKGNFFSALQYHYDKLLSNKANAYEDALFAQTTFSCEFNSVIDSIIDFLRGDARDANPDSLAQHYEYRARKDALKEAIEQVNLRIQNPEGRNRDGKKRWLISISGIDALCRNDGTPLSAEVDVLFDTLARIRG